MNIEIIGGDSAVQKAVADKLAEKGFAAETTAQRHEPWHVSFREPYRAFVVEDDRGNTVCHGPTGAPTERDDRTGRLIAAAPTMLAALLDCYDTFCGETECINGCSTRDMADKCRAAIAKATEGA